MRSKFYLYASGKESDVRALYEHLKLSGSEIKPLKFKPPLAKPDQGVQWMWRSQYQECSTDFPEDELATFLNDNPDLLQHLSAHREALHELAAMIVCQLDEAEQPRGYSVSSDLMRLLADADASLEIDVARLVINDQKDSEG